MRVPRDVFSQNVGPEEVVLLNLRTSLYHGLDKVGSRVWRLLGQHGSVEQAMRTLLQEYDVAEEVLRRDLGVFVQELCMAGLLEVVDA
ncbi:MAG: PqqD family protein [Candidatus Rokuibacteriota bacterium]